MYLIYRERGGLWPDEPTVEYNNLNTAREEAIRLARKHAGAKFYIMQSLGYYQAADVAWHAENEEVERIEDLYTDTPEM